MESRLHCPIPAVEEALSPYIGTRENIYKTRQALSSALSASTGADDAPLSPLTLIDGIVPAKDEQPPITFNGVRKAYVAALRAHQDAQSRFTALKSEVATLQTDILDIDQHAAEASLSRANERITFLRQEQRRKKLQLIQNAFQDVATTKGHPTTLDEIIQTSHRDQPVPPPTGPQLQQPLDETEAHVFKLKKAVLQARNELERPEPSTLTLENGSTPQDRMVSPLQLARDELIAWIEGELAKLPDNLDGGDDPLERDESQATPSENPSEGLDTTSNLDTIRESYERYIAARQALVSVASRPASQTPASSGPLSRISQPAAPTAAPSGPALASSVLPYISPLLGTSLTERALLQQSSYLRRQLGTASSATSQAIARLADESHLVGSGTGVMAAWLDACRDAEEETTAAVRARVEAGEESLARAMEGLGRLMNGGA